MSPSTPSRQFFVWLQAQTNHEDGAVADLARDFAMDCDPSTQTADELICWFEAKSDRTALRSAVAYYGNQLPPKSS
jgi:hypothetical protein